MRNWLVETRYDARVKVLALLLALTVGLWVPWPCLAEGTSETMGVPAEALPVEEPEVESEEDRLFQQVSADEIPVQVSARLWPPEEARGQVSRKILQKFTPIRLTLENQSGRLLRIPRRDIRLGFQDGTQMPPPGEQEIFEQVRRHGVRRGALWAVPLGVASFGILLIPAAVLSGAHTKSTNGSTRINLAQNLYKDAHLPPEGTLQTILFVPKAQASALTQVVLGRVIDTERDLETHIIVEIERSTSAHDPIQPL